MVPSHAPVVFPTMHLLVRRRRLRHRAREPCKHEAGAYARSDNKHQASEHFPRPLLVEFPTDL